jgi:phytoene dehydrogenase-like protein
MSEKLNQTEEPRSADVIVVGAGHNGVIAGCYLAKAGLDVLIVERHSTPGGMTWTEPMPGAPDHLINSCAIHASSFQFSPIKQELELVTRFGMREWPIDPAHVQGFPDGESLALWKDARKTAEEIKYFSPKDAKAWLEMSEMIDAAFQITVPYLLANPMHPGPKVIWHLLTKSLRHFKHWFPLARTFAGSMAEVLEERFESPIVRAPISTALPFSNFRDDMSGWGMIYLAVLQRYGLSMYEGGTGNFVQSCIRCFETYGGKMRLSAPVEKLIVKGGRVTGVRLKGGEELVARKGVVTAFSPKVVLNDLLPEGTLDRVSAVRAKYIPTNRRGNADYKLDVACKGRLELPKHTAWRKKRGIDIDLRIPTFQWATHEDALDAYDDCKRGIIPKRICGLAQLTTAFDPSMGPPGQDTFWFWSGLTPYDPVIGWEKARTEITNRLIKDAADYYSGLEELEIARYDLCMPQLEERFGDVDGSPYHCDPVLARGIGPVKPALGFAGYETPVPGLYLSGSGTHPVAGFCGVPGRNAAMTMIKNFRKE